MERVRTQVAFGPRIPGTDGHAAMQAWLVEELEKLGGRVEVQTFRDSVFGEVRDMANVIARFGPETGRPILLGAHWDTRWQADRDEERPTDPVPGANDGGSGVAVLFEVAELMRSNPPARGVELVFFDGEDQGRASVSQEFCRGSLAYSETLAARLEDGTAPIAGFVFDMVGDADLDIYPEGISMARASNLVSLVLDGARETGATSFHRNQRAAVMDDHVHILNAGVPAIVLIDLDYDAWHTTRDLPDQVSVESLTEVARVAAWIVYRSPLARP